MNVNSIRQTSVRAILNKNGVEWCKNIADNLLNADVDIHLIS